MTPRKRITVAARNAREMCVAVEKNTDDDDDGTG